MGKAEAHMTRLQRKIARQAIRAAIAAQGLAKAQATVAEKTKKKLTLLHSNA